MSEQEHLVGPDLSDPDVYLDPRIGEIWDELRAVNHVVWTDSMAGDGFWSVVGHRAALHVYRDWQAFTSERGMRLGADDRAVASAAGRMLIVTDPPRHTKLRRVLNEALKPRLLARLEGDMRDVVSQSLDVALDADSVDFVTEVALKLPSIMVCLLMGVPAEDHERLVRLTSTAFGSTLGDERPITDADRLRANAKIFVFFRDLVRRRRERPGDDLISGMIAGEIDGEGLSDDDIILNCNGLLSGANETTRLVSAGALLALLEHPSEWQRLGAGEVPINSAVEEFLRWISPTLHVARTATKDSIVAGAPVRAGDQVIIWNPAANRDGSEFDRPGTLDLSRSPNRHLAFGAGPHFCIGAALARIELRVLLATFLARVRSFELTGTPRRMNSNFMWGIESLPVRLQAS